MKKLICTILIVCMIPVFAFAEGFGITVPEFIRQYNDHSIDKPIDNIFTGNTYGKEDVQFIRLKADDGVEIFLRYFKNLDSELYGIIIVQNQLNPDFEKMLSVAASATYILTKNMSDGSGEIVNDLYRAICESIASYGYDGKPVPVTVTGYTVQYQIDDGTRQIFIAPY